MFKSNDIADCTCGCTHDVAIWDIALGKGLIANLHERINKLGLAHNGLLIADKNTFPLAGEQVIAEFSKAGKKLKTFVFEHEQKLVPNETSVGELFINLGLSYPEQPDFLVALGSGTITDLVRYAAFIHKIPFIVIATAPSMDGYASVGCPLVINGKKQTIYAKVPLAIYADTEIIKQAPLTMIKAGFGDIIGKLTAKADWLLGHLHKGEYYCDKVQIIVDQAVATCIENADKIQARDGELMEKQMEALILSGSAMSMVGNSRPASGAEHYIAHYFENQMLKSGLTLYLHGHLVAVGSYLAIKCYEVLFERVKATNDAAMLNLFSRITAHLPSSTNLKEILQTVGIEYRLNALGIPRSWAKKAMLQAIERKDRYYCLTFAAEKGWLNDVVDQVLEEVEDA